MLCSQDIFGLLLCLQMQKIMFLKKIIQNFNCGKTQTGVSENDSFCHAGQWTRLFRNKSLGRMFLGTGIITREWSNASLVCWPFEELCGKIYCSSQTSRRWMPDGSSQMVSMCTHCSVHFHFAQNTKGRDCKNRGNATPVPKRNKNPHTKCGGLHETADLSVSLSKKEKDWKTREYPTIWSVCAFSLNRNNIGSLHSNNCWVFWPFLFVVKLHRTNTTSKTCLQQTVQLLIIFCVPKLDCKRWFLLFTCNQKQEMEWGCLISVDIFVWHRRWQKLLFDHGRECTQVGLHVP